MPACGQGGSGADGLCVALVDPSKLGWLMSGDYGGGLGYNNRPGAVVGVGFDSWGNFADGGSDGGNSGTIVVKGGEPEGYPTIAQLPFRVQTSGEWRCCTHSGVTSPSQGQTLGPYPLPDAHSILKLCLRRSATCRTCTTWPPSPPAIFHLHTTRHVHPFALLFASRRSVKIKFDLDDGHASISVKIDDGDVWEGVNLGDMNFPEQMAVAFTASTGGCNNFHAIRKLELKEEFEWDD